MSEANTEQRLKDSELEHSELGYTWWTFICPPAGLISVHLLDFYSHHADLFSSTVAFGWSTEK